MLGACRSHLTLATTAPWIFLEANPEDVTPDACAAWRGLGVRTLSLGVQSFSDEALRFLGRRHSARRRRGPRSRPRRPPASTPSRSTSSSACRTRPPEAWRRELATAAALGPGHLSCYQLTIHPRTRFGVAAKRGPALRDARGRAGRPLRAHAPLPRRTRATPRTRSRTSRAAATTSRATTASTGTTRPTSGSAPRRTRSPSRTRVAVPTARRWWNERRTPRWEGRVAAGERPVEGEESLGPKALATEAVMLGLRTTAGIDLDAFTARYGFDLVAANDALVARLVGRGPPRRARRRGGWPTAGADGVRAGRRRRHGHRVRHPASGRGLQRGAMNPQPKQQPP